MSRVPYILGLDLGVNSIGWAVISDRWGETPPGAGNGKSPLIAAGVRVFEAGVEGDIEAGKDESRAVKRRLARLARRQLWRRARRLARTFRVLSGAGLLPAADPSPAARHEAIKNLDVQLLGKFVGKLEGDAEKRRAAHLLPYILRARALDEKLEPFELGRAFYHLAQRRGYMSNRRASSAEIAEEDRAAREKPGRSKKTGGKTEKSGARDDEESRQRVEKAIADLDAQMKASGARTLGEFFSRLDPEQTRIRQRYTSRAMYKAEFEAIWNAQKRHYPDLLTDDLKRRLHKAVFFQRPLKSSAGLIGFCELEPGHRRAAMASLPAQRFRLLQKVNDILYPDPETGEMKPLTPQMREKLIAALEEKGNLTFDEMRKLLALPRNAKFNLEEGGEEKIPGDRTQSRLCKVFGPRWFQMPLKDREDIVKALLGAHDGESVRRLGRGKFGLPDAGAEKLAETPLEDGRAPFSRKALLKLLPHLEAGLHLQEAIGRVYPDHFRKAEEPSDFLPPVFSAPKYDKKGGGRKAVGLFEGALPTLRNPAVARTLTEMRKVVNALIRKYGKPERIRVELARDLRNPRRRREEIARENRENEKARKAAKERLLKECGISQPKGTDIEKALLWDECGGVCPYTGKPIDFRSLFGERPRFDIEHIIPFSRSLDDSFENKTLCCNEENRNRKGNRTPWEAYHGTPQWDEIIARVRRFHGRAAKEKLKRFLMDGEAVKKRFRDFTAGQLKATQYAARIALKYLGKLYGGTVERTGAKDAKGTLRVQPANGKITSYLRELWGLNAILGGPGDSRKKRDDYRHHAIDAICVALTEPKTVKRLSEAAERGLLEKRKSGRPRRFGITEEPWPSFLDDVRKTVEAIVVSHRVNRKVSGPLHEETNYSPPRDESGRISENGRFVHVRKPLARLSESEVSDIVDPAIRKIVEDCLKGRKPGDAFKDPASLPFMTAGDGRKIPVKKVRIRKTVSVEKIGEGPGERFVKPGGNHHMAIYEKGGKWFGEVVSMLEAYRRLRSGEPVVRRDRGDGSKFVFSICPGDTIRLRENDRFSLFRVPCITVNEKGYVQLEIKRINDARPSSEVRSSKGWCIGRTFISVGKLQDMEGRKVILSSIGEVRIAND
ncbi:MAG: type II CRISPR RNA-guided endonuclease Cas9 [Planctomycetota bacterium]|nr:type II CRISPR RNA-guided endonuclease Cas9 [Planctomycetota bacterium]